MIPILLINFFFEDAARKITEETNEESSETLFEPPTKRKKF